MKKTLFPAFAVFLLSFFFSACSEVSPEAQLKANRKQNFDFDWRFALGDHPEAAKPAFDDSGWRLLDLPHDWSIEGQIDPQNPTGNDGGYFPAGIAWYRKSFSVPNEWAALQVAIYFEGVYMNAEVFVNGQSLGMHPYGYTSFKYELAPYLNFGEENTIAVRVDNSQQKNCRWYSGSGIYRHVRLTVKSPVHVAQWGVAVTTPTVSEEQAAVWVKTTLKNETAKAQTIQLTTVLNNVNSVAVGEAETEVLLEAQSQQQIEQKLVIDQPALWSTESPNLYTAESNVFQEGSLVDQQTTSFGVRSIEYSAEKGLLLNGKSLVLNGGCVHHDNGILGAAAYDRAEERRVELLKAAGFNAVRTSHNPPSEAFLDACDRLGLLVIDESFDGWRVAKTPHDYATIFDNWWQADLEAMVLRDRNHPSIIMWSSGNEIIERTSPEAVKTAHLLNSYIRELDPSRPVTSAMTSWGEGWEIFDPLMAEHDICGYNYQMHQVESDHERVPTRVILQTESYPRDAFANWNTVRQHPYVIGDFVWTAMDYLGESSIGRYYYPGERAGQHWEGIFFPWHGAYCGDIDLTGWRKPISHYRSMLWNDDEKLYLAVREPNPAEGPITETMWAVWPTWESWTWPGFEGKELEVEVYSKYPKVQLYLNEQFIGEKATGLEQEFKATFRVPYAAGTLKAVGIGGDEAVENKSLKTAGSPNRISLKADRSQLVANGQDLLFVTVEITDDEGNISPNADNELRFAIAGEGSIAGLGDGNLKETEPYVGNTCSAWKGRALVVLKSSKLAGEIKLSVEADGLVGSELQVTTKATTNL